VGGHPYLSKSTRFFYAQNKSIADLGYANVGRPEYPKNIREFRGQFTSDEDCFEYLIQSKWPDGFVCPKYSGKSIARISSRDVIRCRSCRQQFYPLAGTVMPRSHVPIQEWFWAAYLVATHTPEMSARQLQRQLGIGSYDTAWHMLHRLRK